MKTKSKNKATFRISNFTFRTGAKFVLTGPDEQSNGIRRDRLVRAIPERARAYHALRPPLAGRRGRRPDRSFIFAPLFAPFDWRDWQLADDCGTRKNSATRFGRQRR